MKKLNLKKLKLNNDDLIQRNELKTVMGGYDDGSGSGGCWGFMQYCIVGGAIPCCGGATCHREGSYMHGRCGGILT